MKKIVMFAGVLVGLTIGGYGVENTSCVQPVQAATVKKNGTMKLKTKTMNTTLVTTFSTKDIQIKNLDNGQGKEVPTMLVKAKVKNIGKKQSITSLATLASFEQKQQNGTYSLLTNYIPTGYNGMTNEERTLVENANLHLDPKASTEVIIPVQLQGNGKVKVKPAYNVGKSYTIKVDNINK